MSSSSTTNCTKTLLYNIFFFIIMLYLTEIGIGRARESALGHRARAQQSEKQNMSLKIFSSIHHRSGLWGRRRLFLLSLLMKLCSHSIQLHIHIFFNSQNIIIFPLLMLFFINLYAHFFSSRELSYRCHKIARQRVLCTQYTRTHRCVDGDE